MLNDFTQKKNSQVHFQNIQGSAFSASFFLHECWMVSLFTTLNPESFVKVESVKLFICSDWWNPLETCDACDSVQRSDDTAADEKKTEKKVHLLWLKLERT